MAEQDPGLERPSSSDAEDIAALRKLVLHLERKVRSSTRTSQISEEISENSKRLLLSTQDKLEKEVLQHQKTVDELRDASLASKAASDAKSRFLATMSHEMRTPLNGVVGILDLLLETQLDMRQRELGRLAHDSARALVVLINRVLKFSKMEAGRLELLVTPVDVRQSLESLVALEAIAAHTKGLKICTVIDPRLPRQLLVDGDRLRQILLNLISNAVRYTQSGEVDLRVGFRSEGGSGVLTCEVSDTGVGMNPQDCSLLFEPFTQADSSITRAFEGTGLGLSISRRLAELMGGSLTVESHLGKGSTFRLVVPSAPAEQVEERTPRPVLRGQRIGVLDRHDAFVDFVRAVVEPLGGQVVRALDEDEARQLAAGGSLFVLLADHEFGEVIASPPGGVPLIPTGPQERTTLAGLPSLSKPLRASRLAEVLILCLAKTTNTPLSAGEARGPRTAPSSLASWSARVLVVDDNQPNRSVARLMLERLGCRVETVDNGLSALDCIATKAFDLVFMDCSMPGLDGYETTRRLRARSTTTRGPTVVAMTAFAMADDRQRCLDAGMDDYVSKPVGLERIREVLNDHLGPPEESVGPPEESDFDAPFLAESPGTPSG